MKVTNLKVLVMLLFLAPLMTLAQSGGQRKSDLVVVLIKKYITEKRPDQIYAPGSKSKLASVPGEVYSYSNMGTGLLGVILERISGKTYAELVKEIITLSKSEAETDQAGVGIIEKL